MTDLPFSEVNAIWPDLGAGQVLISPPRNGMDRFTGKLLQGWQHVEQSLELIFLTPFHQRVLRRWVGSFVPHVLGEIAVERVITRFYWAISTSIDLWEPDYRIRNVAFMGQATPGDLSPTATEALYRQGNVFFRTEGMWYPRGHLGDFTPYVRQAAGLVTNGGSMWDVVPVGGI